MDFPIKTEWRTVCAEVFSDIRSVTDSHRLFGFACILQAEVLTVLAACRWLGHGPNFKHIIVTLIENKAAIRALYSEVTSSRLVGQWRDALNIERNEQAWRIGQAGFSSWQSLGGHIQRLVGDCQARN